MTFTSFCIFRKEIFQFSKLYHLSCGHFYIRIIYLITSHWTTFTTVLIYTCEGVSFILSWKILFVNKAFNLDMMPCRNRLKAIKRDLWIWLPHFLELHPSTQPYRQWRRTGHRLKNAKDSITLQPPEMIRLENLGTCFFGVLLLPGNNNNKMYVLDLRGIFVAFTLTTLAGHNIVFHL